MPTLPAATKLTSHRSATRLLLGATVALFLVCASPAHAAPTAGLLNDTGQTLCDNGSNVMAACSNANTGDAATYPRQDGRFGRDAATFTKTGGGAAGFDFTRVCMNGDLAGSGSCAASPTAATDQALPNPSDWACTKDNVTNLIWSLQSGSGDWTTYAQVTLPGEHNAANAGVGRCGGTGWRLPTLLELLSIVHNGLATPPTIDANYFPDVPVTADSSIYWTSDVYMACCSQLLAWIVEFRGGDSRGDTKTKSHYVRLVRSGP